jgi:hypothetical protein
MSALLETPSDMHRIAGHLRSCAGDVRDHARRLALAAEATRWYSPAARQFREQVHDVARHMHAAAGRLDDAAGALDRHARRVHDVLTAPVHAVESLANRAGF